MSLKFWPFKKKCKHEWLVGEPSSAWIPMYPAICRWCSARKILSATDAHYWKEWQRLEKLRTQFPTGT